MDYLREKVKAQNLMERFDTFAPEVREVMRSANTVHNTHVLLRAGVRRYSQAELAIAGVWDGT